jgi:molybdenum cofactor guanylyltransferase/molybdopterin-guanine dinucleotide biosynthesis protein MobB
MVAHVIDRLKPQVERLVISSNADAERFAPFELPVLADTIPGSAGPLAGVLAGLQWTARHVPDACYAVSAPTDTPFLPDDLVARFLAAERARPGSIVIAASGGSTHPVVALWPVEYASKIGAALARGESKVHAFVNSNDALTVEFPFDERAGRRIDPFFNANTPEDLADARAYVARTLTTPVIGIAGWKNSGKTTLVVRLVAELTRRGLRVATIKHSHHDLRAEDTQTDSAKHLRAGAVQVAAVSPRRWMLGADAFGGPEPALDEVIRRMPPCDLILVEGYKSAPIAKIEVRRADQPDKRPLADRDPFVIAIAADYDVEANGVPVFKLDDVDAIASFIAGRTRAGG